MAPVPFLRRRPGPDALRWVERSLGPNHRVTAWRRLTGGITSAVHRLTIARGGDRWSVVLRQLAPDGQYPAAPQVEREARVLTALEAAELPAPRLLAACTDEGEAGYPSLLMTRVPGRVHLTPDDPDSWIRQIAWLAARIHATNVPAPESTFARWFRPGTRRPPASAIRPEVWRAALDVVDSTDQDRAAVDRAAAGPASGATFIHRDFQHFNFLWSRGRLSGVVDWGSACTGPPSVDLGHCRLNLAILFDADWAERLRLAYEAESGRTVDPFWDLEALLAYGDGWQRFIPIQVDGRAPVDTAGMTARVEATVAATLARLG